MDIFYNTSGLLVENFDECKECNDKLCNEKLMYNKSIKNNQKKIDKFLKLLEVKNIEEFEKKHNNIKSEIKELEEKIDHEKKESNLKKMNQKEIEDINEYNLKIKDLDNCKIIIDDLMINFSFTDDEIEIKKLISKNLRKKFNEFRIQFQSRLDQIKNEYKIKHSETDDTKRKISNKIKGKKDTSNKLLEDLEKLNIKIFEIRKLIDKKTEETKKLAVKAQKLLDDREIKCMEKICPADYSKIIKLCIILQVVLMSIVIVLKIKR